jgi:hypothetical protein
MDTATLFWSANWVAKKYRVLESCVTHELPPGDPNGQVEVYLASEVESSLVGFTLEQIAQLRDLLRCVCWIRDLQISGASDPDHFDNGEIIRDVRIAYCIDQMNAARTLFKQLDDYCKANEIPATVWKMK